MTDETRRDGVTMTNVSHRFDAVAVLEDVSVRFARGRVTALVGENGAGKSTLLKILGGAVHPAAGHLALDGRPVNLDRYSPARAQQLGVAIVHQEQALAEPMTIAQSIFLGHEPRIGLRLDRRAANERARQLLARLGADLDPRLLIADLSLAQRQLVEIAKALSFNAGVVALDEPSAVLGGAELDNLFNVVRLLAEENVAVVYVSHRMDEIFQHCDEFVALRDGKVAGHGETSDVSVDELIRMMVGRPVSTVFPSSGVEPGHVRIDVQHLRVPGKLDDVSFSVRAGEIVGVAGLAGAGRTTLLKTLFGAIAAQGAIAVDGVKVKSFRSPRDAMRAGIAYLPEDRKSEALALPKPVRWNLTIATLGGLTSRLGLVRRRAERRLTTATSAELGIKIAREGDEPVQAMSGGNQQKVVLGRWLHAVPKVLILDEPTRGVDVGAKEQIYKKLRELADSGMALLIVSSELIEVLGLSDRVMVMAGGRIIGEMSHESATEEAVMGLVTRASAREMGRKG